MKINLDQFIDTFEKLSNSLSELILPFGLFPENEIMCIQEEEEAKDLGSFEDSLDAFKITYQQTLMFCKTLITCAKPEINSNKRRNFVYRLDLNIDLTVNNFEMLISSEDSRNCGDIAKVKIAYFAYLSLVRAINTALRQCNENFPNYKFKTLQNVPDPKFLESLQS